MKVKQKQSWAGLKQTRDAKTIVGNSAQMVDQGLINFGIIRGPIANGLHKISWEAHKMGVGRSDSSCPPEQARTSKEGKSLEESFAPPN